MKSRDVDDAVGLLLQDEIAGHDLLAGIGRERVDARQIGDSGLGMAADDAVLAVHRHAGEIAHVLVGTRQLVEQRRLAAVLVAGQRKGQRRALGQGRARLARVVAGRFAKLAHAGVGHRGVARLAAGGAVGVVHVVHRDLGRVVQAQRQLIAAQLHLHGVAHRGHLAQRHLGAGGQAHVQQVVAQLACAAHRADHSVLADLQFCQCHIRPNLPAASAVRYTK